MVAELFLKGKNIINVLTLHDVKNFEISSTNNVLYTYDLNRKVSGIYSKNNLYGIVNKDYMILYLNSDINEVKEKKLNIYEVFIPEFNDSEKLLIAANRYEHNTYTNEVTFKIVTEVNKSATVAIINLNNISGFNLFEYVKPEVID